MEPAPAQFFCLKPPTPGGRGSHKSCEAHLEASLDKATGLGAKLIDITEVAHLSVLGSTVGLRRSEFVFALRFGWVADLNGPGCHPDSSAAAVRRSCERTLSSSNIGYVDLYYQEVVDPNTPTERTMWELRELIKEGKVRYIGLATDDPELLKRACRIHPVAGICLEWSPWKPRSLEKVVRVAREHGLAILAKNPLGRQGDLPLLCERSGDGEDLSGKVEELLDRQYTNLLSAAKNLAERPAEGLEGKVAAIAAGQDCFLANSLSLFLDGHASDLEKTVLKKKEWESAARKILDVYMGQDATLVGNIISIAVNQRKRLRNKMDTWAGQLHSDGVLVSAFRGFVHSQKRNFLNKVMNIRKGQNDELFDAARRAIDDPEFHQALNELVTTQTDSLNQWISLEKENLTAQLMGELHDLRNLWMASARRQLLKMRREQDSMVLQGIAPILRGDSKAMQTIEDVVQDHASIFETTFHDSDFDHKPHSVINKIQKLVAQQSTDMVKKLEAIMQEEDTTPAVPQKPTPLNCSAPTSIKHLKPSDVESHVRSVMSDRICEIARRRGCGQEQICLAWMASQGDDILPMVPVRDPGEMVSIVEGTKMSLTDEELIFLYAGTDISQDG